MNSFPIYATPYIAAPAIDGQHLSFKYLEIIIHIIFPVNKKTLYAVASKIYIYKYIYIYVLILH